ncbi:PE family protein [Mycobacterium kiyosense]|uniref:PE family protein n=1 Tax=Mycobacterium kiyosense TaxID=2871094 RepID=UPI0022323A62
MSFAFAAPEHMAAEATDLAKLGSAIESANSAVNLPTTSVPAAAADEVSAAIAAVFGAHGQAYQALSGEAASFHQQFVTLLNGSAAQYLGTEFANAQQTILGAVNTRTEMLLGRPLIGNGAAGSAANPNGGAAGILYGNGGNGYSEAANGGVAGGNGGAAGLIGFGGNGRRHRHCPRRGCRRRLPRRHHRHRRCRRTRPCRRRRRTRTCRRCRRFRRRRRCCW